MRKFLAFLLLVILVGVVSGCDQNKLELSLKESELDLYVGETYLLNPIVDGLEKFTAIYEIEDPEIISISDNEITALEVGQTLVTVSLENEKVTPVEIVVNVLEEPDKHIGITGDDELTVGDEITLEVEKVNVTGVIEWSSDTEDVATVLDGVVTGLSEGRATITATVGDYSDSITITVKAKKPEPEKSIKITGENKVVVGESITIEVEKINLTGEVIWSSDNEKAASVVNGIVTALSEGTATITATIGEYSDSITITVLAERSKPSFILGDDYQEKVVLNWNKEFNPLKDITASDDFDGDLTNEIKVVKDFNNQNYGVHIVELSVTNSGGKKATMTREVEVVWNYDVNFIGHAGSYYGLMNSEEAFLYAVEVLKYQALETDLKQTKDGVFVLSHDDTFGDYTIANTTWSVLKDVEVTKARNAGIPSANGSVTGSPYTTKLCTLERYLEICKEYNVKAVIELKYSKGINNNDQSRMQALMNEIEKAGMRENVIFLGSQYNCLIWTRENGYSDIECQYLVGSIESETFLQRCIDYDLDISFNVTASYSNSDEWLARYKNAGIKTAVYTFTQYVDYPEVQKWIDKGVDYVTCDWHVMSELTLPEKSDDPLKTHTVTFENHDGSIISSVTVIDGQTASSPLNVTRKGYEFIGWDMPITNVTEDLTVIAQFEIIHYNIIYDANSLIVEESSWANKDEFVTEFYDDFYNWFKTDGVNRPEVTQSGDKFTVSMNGKTVSFSNPDEIKDIGVYDFELTLANFIYKPVTRASDGTAVLEKSNDYFLNTGTYLDKYQALDQWFLNCIENTSNYTHYNKNYQPTAAGKIQIFFRFQQWVQGVSIAQFNILPIKYNVIEDEEFEFTLPTDKLTYTIEDEFDLPLATGDYEFLGWFLDEELTIPITKITKGTTGNITVYAKWDK